MDAAVAAWPGQVLGDAGVVAEIEEFVARIDAPGRSNSLGQKLLQIAGPGVPDVYQGTELYEYSLVDPDNRRPVDWALRRQLLERIDGGWLPDFGGPEADPDGAVKLLVTAQALLLRRQRPELFAGYRPVPAEGPAAHHAIAFARSPQLVAVATRLPIRLAERGGWADTVLPLPDGVATRWPDAFTWLDRGGTLARLPIDQRVGPTPQRGGAVAVTEPARPPPAPVASGPPRKPAPRPRKRLPGPALPAVRR